MSKKPQPAEALPAALFVSDEIFAREVELGDGTRHTLHFKAGWVTALTSPDEGVRDRAHSRLICASLVTPDGEPALTLEQANRLKPKVLRTLGDVIAEINDFASISGND